MKKNTKIKLAGVLLGAALSSTGAYAGNGSCGAGKCGSKNNEMSGNSGKKSVMTCGAGKCGSKMMKEVEEEKNENHMMGQEKKQEMMEKNMMKKEAKKKIEGSCGAGKCG